MIPYDPDGSVEEIASAFIAAAKAFETDAVLRISSISQKLSDRAVCCLNKYGSLSQGPAPQWPSLHFDTYSKMARETEPDARVRFELAIRQLLDSGLMWHDYRIHGQGPGIDTFGYHATELGWAVITRMWHGLKKPEDATTHPAGKTATPGKDVVETGCSPSQPEPPATP